MSDEGKAQAHLEQTAGYVTLIRLFTHDEKSYILELFSETAEEAYLKEKATQKLIDLKEDVKAGVLLGSFKRTTLKVIGE